MTIPIRVPEPSLDLSDSLIRPARSPGEMAFYTYLVPVKAISNMESWGDVEELTREDTASVRLSKPSYW